MYVWYRAFPYRESLHRNFEHLAPCRQCDSQTEAEPEQFPFRTEWTSSWQTLGAMGSVIWFYVRRRARVSPFSLRKCRSVVVCWLVVQSCLAWVPPTLQLPKYRLRRCTSSKAQRLAVKEPRKSQPQLLPTLEAPGTENLHSLLTSAALLVGCCLLDASPAGALPYWETQAPGASSGQRIEANTALMDYAVGTVNTMYYDASGGAYFQPLDFYRSWRGWLGKSSEANQLATREGTVKSLKWLVQSIGDPYSKYLTREELRAELEYADEGFLGSGAIVEPSTESTKQFLFGPGESRNGNGPAEVWKRWRTSESNSPLYLTLGQVDRLPVITAVTPNSPAEHAGLTVGDRIVSIGGDRFLEKDQKAIHSKLSSKYHAENYFGKAYFTVAKPLRAPVPVLTQNGSFRVEESSNTASHAVPDVILGYRSTKVQLPTQATSQIQWRNGNSIVQYEMLKGSIFDQTNILQGDVGYIRLTRFSKASTNGFFDAVDNLERDGASAYIIDLRNNYGGVFQEAMLTASTLLHDPHAILCYTMNSRGGFTSHDVAEYVENTRYPGYLLSSESRRATTIQAKRDSVLDSPRSQHEHPRSRTLVSYSETPGSTKNLALLQQLASQKPIVLLINEGTASSAEVFTAALHDNGRLVALVGSKTYGKGLVQHTFPLPDGGGLRLTVAEYLRPSLQHVSRVGGAQFDQQTGQWVGGGIQPDVYCDSKHGIPSNIGADLCVGLALDALDEADSSFRESGQLTVKRMGGIDDGSKVRRAVTTGIGRVSTGLPKDTCQEIERTSVSFNSILQSNF